MTSRARIRYGTAMEFNLDQRATINVVRAYGPGVVRIGERSFNRSVVVTASALLEDWRPGRIEDLQASDLDALLQLHPEVLLIGSGLRQAFPERAVLTALYAARVGFEIMDTGAACRTYNVLAAEGRNVAAALIVEPPSS